MRAVRVRRQNQEDADWQRKHDVWKQREDTWKADLVRACLRSWWQGGGRVQNRAVANLRRVASAVHFSPGWQALSAHALQIACLCVLAVDAQTELAEN